MDKSHSINAGRKLIWGQYEAILDAKHGFTVPVAFRVGLGAEVVLALSPVRSS